MSNPSCSFNSSAPSSSGFSQTSSITDNSSSSFSQASSSTDHSSSGFSQTSSSGNHLEQFPPREEIIAEIRQRLPGWKAEISPTGQILISQKDNVRKPKDKKLRGKKIRGQKGGQLTEKKLKDIFGMSTSCRYGNKTYLTPTTSGSFDTPLLKLNEQIAILDIPDPLKEAITTLPPRYESMSLSTLLAFQMLKKIRTPSSKIKASELQEYHRLYRQQIAFIHRCQQAEIKPDDIAFIEGLIQDTASEDKDIVPLLIQIRSYLRSHGSPVTEREKRVWFCPFRYFKLDQLITLYDMRNTAEVQSEAFLCACWLPTLLNDFKSILNSLYQSTSIFEASKEQFRQFMTVFYENVDTTLIPIETLQAWTASRPEGDPLLVEFQTFSKTTDDAIMQIYDPQLPISDALREALQGLVKTVKYPPCDIDGILSMFSTPQMTIDHLSTLYDVDIAPIVEMFSQSRGHRLHRDKLDRDIMKLINHRREEFSTINAGIQKLKNKIKDVYKQLFIIKGILDIFPLWFYIYGDNYIEGHFKVFLDTLKLNPVGKLKNELFKGFVKDFPSLSQDYFKLPLVNDNMLKMIKELDVHLNVIEELGLTLEKVCQTLEEKKALDKSEKALDKAEFEAQQKTSYIMQQTLIDEEKGRSSQPSLRPRKNRSSQQQASRSTLTPLHSQAIPPISSSSTQIIETTPIEDPRTRRTDSSEPSSSFSSSIDISTSDDPSAVPGSSIGSEAISFSEEVVFPLIEMENSFALESWLSANEIFKDVIAELMDRPNVEKPKEVAAHVTRLVNLLSLFVEQFVSSHYLETKQPKDPYERWGLLRHNIFSMFNQSGLTEIPGLKDLIEDLDKLDSFSRSLYTSPKRSGRGAQLLYQAEAIRKKGDPRLQSELIEKTDELLRDVLKCTQQSLHIDTSSVKSMSSSSSSTEPSSSRLTSTDRSLIKSIEMVINQFPEDIDALTLDLANSQNPYAYYADAKRLLDLLSVRLTKGSNGNVRNYHKVLTTYLPLAMTSFSIGKSSLTGKLNLHDFSYTREAHNLMDWCERLECYDLSDPETDFLYRSSRVLNFVRYHALYNPSLFGDTARSFHKHIAIINRHIPVDRDGWRQVGGKSSAVHAILEKERQFALTGLNIIRKLAN